MSNSTGLLVNFIHRCMRNEGTSGCFYLFCTGHLRLCYINFVAQFHTLHKHFIHYHVPFNKVVKHSFCQTTSIHCARFLETIQKYKKHGSANTITSLVNGERFPLHLCHAHTFCVQTPFNQHHMGSP